MKANSMTSRKTYRHLKGHISTAYKDNKIYTMYTMLKKKQPNNQRNVLYLDKNTKVAEDVMETCHWHIGKSFCSF